MDTLRVRMGRTTRGRHGSIVDGLNLVKSSFKYTAQMCRLQEFLQVALRDKPLKYNDIYKKTEKGIKMQNGSAKDAKRREAKQGLRRHLGRF